MKRLEHEIHSDLFIHIDLIFFDIYEREQINLNDCPKNIV